MDINYGKRNINISNVFFIQKNNYEDKVSEEIIIGHPALRCSLSIKNEHSLS